MQKQSTREFIYHNVAVLETALYSSGIIYTIIPGKM